LKKRKNLKLHKGIYTLYFSLFLLWIINSFSQIIIQISPVLMGVFYVIHAGLFLIILYLISKKIKNGKKER